MKKLLEILKKLDPLVHLVLLGGIVALGVGYFFLLDRVEFIKLEKPKIIQKEDKVEVVESGPSAEEIDEIISKAIATISGVPKTQTVYVDKPTVEYISLDTQASLSNTDWTDAPGLEVQFDLDEDYGSDAVVAWEAFLKVDQGNGEAFARLYDVTNKRAVDGSEISTKGNASYERVSSSNLSIWRGRNIYRVQLKSLNGFEVGFVSGKLRVTH